MKKFLIKVPLNLILLALVVIPFVFAIYAALISYDGETPLTDINTAALLDFSGKAFLGLLVKFNFSLYFYNSLIIGTMASVLTVLFSSMMAYAVKSWEGFMKYSMLCIVFAGIVFPVQLVYGNSLEILKLVNFTSTTLGEAVFIAALTIPFSTFVFWIYFRRTPAALTETAILDGLSKFHIYSKVEMTTAKSATVITVFYCMIVTFNDYLIGHILQQKNGSKTLTQAIIDTVQTNKVNNVDLFALISLCILFAFFVPIIIENLVPKSAKE